MKNCSVCGNTNMPEEPAILFVGVAGEQREICEECEKYLDMLSEKKDDASFEEARKYFLVHIMDNGYASDDRSIVRFIVNVISEKEKIVDVSEDQNEEDANEYEDAVREAEAEEALIDKEKVKEDERKKEYRSTMILLAALSCVTGGMTAYSLIKKEYFKSGYYGIFFALFFIDFILRIILKNKKSKKNGKN